MLYPFAVIYLIRYDSLHLSKLFNIIFFFGTVAKWAFVNWNIEEMHANFLMPNGIECVDMLLNDLFILFDFFSVFYVLVVFFLLVFYFTHFIISIRISLLIVNSFKYDSFHLALATIKRAHASSSSGKRRMDEGKCLHAWALARHFDTHSTACNVPA